MKPEDQFIPIHEAVEVDNYPYGRLKATATFALEFNPKKGFRHLFQTINPKNGRVNKPKMSTYQPVAWMYREAATGHIKWNAKYPSGYEDVNEVARFIQENQKHIQYTPEQQEYICSYLFAVIRGNFGYTAVDKEILKEILRPTLDALIEGIKTRGAAVPWGKVNIPLEKIKENEDQEHAPKVTVTSYMMYEASSKPKNNDEEE